MAITSPLVSAVRRGVVGEVDALSALIKQLFGNGEQGAFYLPQPIVNGQQVLFQDAAGTIPVTADGDPVGLMKDLSGNEVDPEQVASLNQPTFQLNSEGARLVVDGTDDSMGIATPGLTGELTISFAIQAADVGSGRMWLGSSNGNDKIGAVSGNWFVRLVDGGASLLVAQANTNTHVVTVTRDSGNVARLYVDGSLVGSESMPGPVAFSDLFASVSGSQFFVGSMYGAVIVSSIGARGSIESYLAQLSGVSMT